MIIASNLTKTFGNNILFQDINFQINPGEKVGLIGRNGSGKSTLFKIITNEESLNEGKITIPNDYKLGYLKQHLDFSHNSIIDECLSVMPEENKYDKWLVEKYLFGIGFNENLIKLSPSLLSGGFQIRLNLVKVLLSDPQILLLDEPTNYLDITSIRWLENFLKSWKKELLLITHDKTFMDKITTHTMIIYRKKIKKIKGNTDKLYNQIQTEEEVYEKQRINEEKKRKQDEIFITKFRAKARLAGMVQSRIKQLEKKEKKEKLEKIKNLNFYFKYKKFEPGLIAEIKNLTFGYDLKSPLIKDLSFFINKHEKIAVIGPNGKGKTTLLKLITGELSKNKGEIKIHQSCEYAYYSQSNESTLHPEHTVEDEVYISNKENDIQTIRNICASLMFEGDDALKKISVLSGGEKARVLLAKILAKPVNLLILDEPTNHLDMESCNSLYNAIADFGGSVIFVTHNEMFIRDLADKLIIFDNNETFLFNGKYDEFLDKIGWVEEKDIKKSETSVKNKISTKEIRKIKANILSEKNKILKPIELKYKNLEIQIIELEDNIENCKQELSQAVLNKEGNLIQKLSKQLHNDEKILQEKYYDFDQLSDKINEITKEYNLKLEKI